MSSEYRTKAARDYTDRVRIEQLSQHYTVYTMDCCRSDLTAVTEDINSTTNPTVNTHRRGHVQADYNKVTNPTTLKRFKKGLEDAWQIGGYLPRFTHICVEYLQHVSHMQQYYYVMTGDNYHFYFYRVIRLLRHTVNPSIPLSYRG